MNYSGGGGGGEGDDQTLMEIYDEMSRVLATSLRACLKSVEPFLSAENSFSHLQLFRATFCLDYVREGIVTAYLRFLIQFCEDLSKFTPSSVPGCLILLMGKLCLEWANSGTIGHLLNTADEFLMLGQPKCKASHRSDILLENLATSHPSNSSEDILSFANAASDIISEGIMSYVFTYSSRFLSNRTLNNDQVDEDLETTLFDFLQGVTTKFLDFINAELQSRVESTEIDLLVRALERLYSRLMAFGRSVLEVVVPPNQSPSLSPNDFKKHLDEATLNMVLIVAENCCRKKQFQALKVQTADCLTDVRQKLVTSVCLKPKKEQVLVFF
nr:hypothetical transcript [Hymenolepis microstoma]